MADNPDRLFARASGIAAGALSAVLVATLLAPGAAATTQRAAKASPVGLVAAAKSPAIVLKVNSTKAQVGERLWLTARNAPTGSTVALQVRDLERVVKKTRVEGDDGTTRKVTEVTYRARGKWRAAGDTRKATGPSVVLHARVESSARYRVVVARKSGRLASKPVDVIAHKVGKSLEDRREQLGSRVGRATSKVRVVKGKVLKSVKRVASTVKTVRWQKFSDGVLVEVTSGGRTRTWAAVGKIGESYVKSGGPRGAWGIPRADAECDLLDAGCLQPFTAGTASSSTRTNGASWSSWRGKRGEVAAALRSWLGYRVTAQDNDKTPIQKWMCSPTAWCGFLQVWGFHASGNADLLPAKRKLIPYSSLRAAIRKSMKRGSKPKLGALAFVTSVRGRPAGHVGLVTGITETHIRMVHGNTQGGGVVARGYRGVVETKISRKAVNYYIYPAY